MEIIGYIVTNDDACCQIGNYGDGVDVLCIGSGAATVFETRRQARTAIKRSNDYAKRERLGWSRKHEIVRLVKP